MSPETYEGARDYDALSAFAKESIAHPICSIYKLENCNTDEKQVIDGLRAKSIEELEEIAIATENEVREAESVFDKEVGILQKQYDDVVTAFNEKLDVITKKHNYKYVEQLLASLGHGEADDVDDSTADGDEL